MVLVAVGDGYVDVYVISVRAAWMTSPSANAAEGDQVRVRLQVLPSARYPHCSNTVVAEGSAAGENEDVFGGRALRYDGKSKTWESATIAYRTFVPQPLNDMADTEEFEGNGIVTVMLIAGEDELLLCCMEYVVVAGV